MLPPRQRKPAPEGRLIAGPGVLIDEQPDGTVISFDGSRALFLHAFRVTLSGKSARLRPGFVNGLPVFIGERALDDEPAPQLVWQRTKLDAAGRGWIALEATLGKKWEVASAQIVQVASLDTDDGEAAPPAADDATPGYSGGAPLTLSGRRARHPIALLRRRASGQLVCFQFTRHDLQHRVQVIDEARQIARHFFSAVGV